MGRVLSGRAPGSGTHRAVGAQLSWRPAADEPCPGPGINWSQFLALFGFGNQAARFDFLRPEGAGAALGRCVIQFVAVTLLEVLPYLEELVRGLRANNGNFGAPKAPIAARTTQQPTSCAAFRVAIRVAVVTGRPRKAASPRNVVELRFAAQMPFGWQSENRRAATPLRNHTSRSAFFPGLVLSTRKSTNRTCTKENKMKMSMSATALVSLMLFAPPALAQTTATPPAVVTPAPATQSQWYSSLGSEMRASKLIGTTVRNDANEFIGSINEIVLNKDGKVAAVVIGVGGFLGMGEREVAAKFELLRIAQDSNNRTVVSLTTKESC